MFYIFNVYIYICIYIYICYIYMYTHLYQCKMDYNKLLKSVHCPDLVKAWCLGDKFLSFCNKQFFSQTQIA